MLDDLLSILNYQLLLGNLHCKADSRIYITQTTLLCIVPSGVSPPEGKWEDVEGKEMEKPSFGSQTSVHKWDLPHCCTLRELMRGERFIQHGPAFCIKTVMCLWVTTPLSLISLVTEPWLLELSLSRFYFFTCFACLHVNWLPYLYILYTVTHLDVYNLSHHTFMNSPQMCWCMSIYYMNLYTCKYKQKQL